MCWYTLLVTSVAVDGNKQIDAVLQKGSASWRWDTKMKRPSQGSSKAGRVFLTYSAIIWQRIPYWLFLSGSDIHEWTPRSICFVLGDSSRVHCALHISCLFSASNICAYSTVCAYHLVLVFTTKKMHIYLFVSPLPSFIFVFRPSWCIVRFSIQVLFFYSSPLPLPLPLLFAVSKKFYLKCIFHLSFALWWPKQARKEKADVQHI